MTDWTLDGHLGPPVTVDVCANCQAFWFDEFKSLQLAARSTLQLMKYIGEHSSTNKPTLPQVLYCPRCKVKLALAHDMSRSVRFTYWRCDNEHGRFIAFFEFLKEKNFIHPLSPDEIKKLRENVQFLNCAHCGAAIDLESATACPFCHSPISMLDLKHPQELLAQLKDTAEPRPVDPALPLKLTMAKLDTEHAFAPLERGDQEWWDDARSSNLVQAGLNAVGRWLGNLVV